MIIWKDTRIAPTCLTRFPFLRHSYDAIPVLPEERSPENGNPALLVESGPRRGCEKDKKQAWHQSVQLEYELAEHASPYDIEGDELSGLLMPLTLLTGRAEPNTETVVKWGDEDEVSQDFGWICSVTALEAALTSECRQKSVVSCKSALKSVGVLQLPTDSAVRRTASRGSKTICSCHFPFIDNLLKYTCHHV